MNKLAVIGGTGIEQLEGLVVYGEHQLETPYGQPSGAIQQGRLGNAQLLFLHRHGGAATIPPHLINYRANLWALRSLGASDVVGINAVGGITSTMGPGSLVLPHQLIDYTWGREHSVDEGADGRLLHIDFTEPYDNRLRQSLVAAAYHSDIAFEDGATHGVAQGPRLETAAEVRRMARDGCDIVGMTGMPEASIARELGLAYAAICMVVNPAAGLGEEPISLAKMHEILQRETQVVRALLSSLVEKYYSE